MESSNVNGSEIVCTNERHQKMKLCGNMEMWTEDSH